MEYPIKVFDIIGSHQEHIKLEILEVFDFPKQTSFRGGYDIRCKLDIVSGIYAVSTSNYYSSTAALYNFYIALQDCYNNLGGNAIYSVYCPENDFVFETIFNKQGKVFINGKYRENPAENNFLNFEFCSDQSYFPTVLIDLKQIVSTFGDATGVR